MKSIELHGNPNVYLLKSWLLPVLFGGLLIIDYIESNKFNFLLAISFLSWGLVIAANRRGFFGGNSRSKYILELGETDLVCRFENSIFWHIPLSRISHAGEEISSGTIFLPKVKRFLIYTKDGDSYSIPITINSKQVVEIKGVIERIGNA